MVDAPENPPAFPMQPVTASGKPCSPESGMTLRDYFAGQALVGFLSNAQFYVPDAIGCRAYEAADAMLAEREAQS